MQIPRGVWVGAGAVVALAFALALVGGAQGDWNNASRIDAGVPVEVRINEGFDVAPAGYYEDPPAVEAREFWWDLDNRTDTGPVDGNPTNDRDEFNLAFHFPGFDRTGTWLFTLWINYSDGRLVNGTRLITVVTNDPPIIDPPQVQPTGVVGDPISFTVTVRDNDSLESTLEYAWDFDVGTDSDLNGVPDDDIDSQAKANVTHTYNAEGTYTAKLTVADDYGAESFIYITVVVTRPPGVCQREVKETVTGQFYTEPVTIRKLCYASYHIKVSSGRLYQYTVEVSNDVPVYIMVQMSRLQYESYKDRTSALAYRSEWSTVTAPTKQITVQFRADFDGIAYVSVDNGFLFGLDPGKESSLTVTVEDVDRNNLLANVPIYVWIGVVAVVAGVAGVFLVRGYVAGAEVRRREREQKALMQQEKLSAKSELEQFLSNPDAVIERKMAPPPPPPPMAVPAQGVPGAAPAARTPAPRPAGPQAPPGYVPPPPPPPPPPAAYVPSPAPSAGPRPGPASGPQPSAAAACPNCASPIEAGWQLCPNCGQNL